MGRKRKPAHLKVVEGTFRNDRDKPADLDVRAEIPTPPSFLSELAREEWDEMSVELYDLGLLSKVDKAALAAYCQSYGRWAAAELALAKEKLTTTTSNGNRIQNPLVGIANTSMEKMRRFLVEFGMTPATRANVQKIKRRQADEWDLFADNG